MIQVSDHNSEWHTLKESSRITGKSINALRILIYRKKLDKIKKVSNVGKKDIWLIHKDSLSQIEVKNTSLNGIQGNTFQNTIPDGIQNTIQNTIPLDYFDGKLKEWENMRSQLEQGLLMYRYKFEEIEKQIRLLPAPVETVASRLQEKEAALAQAQNIIHEAQLTQKQYESALAELRQKLQEEEQAKENIRVQFEKATLPLWKKLLIACGMWKA